MEFSEALKKRRMVRNYQPRPVCAGAVDRIVTAGLSAPSAGYSQGQSLIVVTEISTRQRIAQLADEPRYVAGGFQPWLSVAPVHIVVCVSAAAYRRRYRERDKQTGHRPGMQWPVPYWWVDAGATLMAVLLAAVDEGLAAGFFGAHALPGLSALLDIPDEVAPVGVVTVGYPAPDRRSGSLRRGKRPPAEVAHSERWGRPLLHHGSPADPGP
ncbi:MAG: nitroreductase family protein [Actinomycetia bacterium]|nr:nitroreductase family protein [Actinomycetes bacterium]